LGPALAGLILWAPRLIRRGTSCARFGSLSEAIIIGGNIEHRLLGRFVVHLICEGARFSARFRQCSGSLMKDVAMA
jgi:hypothetical protein